MTCCTFSSSTPMSSVTFPASRKPPVVDRRVDENPFLVRFWVTAPASSWLTMAIMSFIPSLPFQNHIAVFFIISYFP